MSRTTYVLIPGAGGEAWYWHLVVPRLQERGHDALAVSLPAGDDSAGWAAYADAIVESIGDRTGVILVAQSLAGFSAPPVCERVSVELLILLNAMIPRPGETGAEWWSNTRQPEAQHAHLAGSRALAGGRRRGRDRLLPRCPAADPCRGGPAWRAGAIVDADD